MSLKRASKALCPLAPASSPFTPLQPRRVLVLSNFLQALSPAGCAPFCDSFHLECPMEN